MKVDRFMQQWQEDLQKPLTSVEVEMFTPSPQIRQDIRAPITPELQRAPTEILMTDFTNREPTRREQNQLVLTRGRSKPIIDNSTQFAKAKRNAATLKPLTQPIKLTSKRKTIPIKKRSVDNIQALREQSRKLGMNIEETVAKTEIIIPTTSISNESQARMVEGLRRPPLRREGGGLMPDVNALEQTFVIPPTWQTAETQIITVLPETPVQKTTIPETFEEAGFPVKYDQMYDQWLSIFRGLEYQPEFREYSQNNWLKVDGELEKIMMDETALMWQILEGIGEDKSAWFSSRTITNRLFKMRDNVRDRLKLNTNDYVARMTEAMLLDLGISV
ncbi:MAG TPA: hypothetical protein VEP90_21340 [Methylomirabilota bacterium]|nr:hypothetical protein [Methylomirabilota bacterium]